MRAKYPSGNHLQPIGEAALWGDFSCWLRPLNSVSQHSFRHASDKLEAFGREPTSPRRTSENDAPDRLATCVLGSEGWASCGFSLAHIPSDQTLAVRRRATEGEITAIKLQYFFFFFGLSKQLWRR